VGLERFGVVGGGVGFMSGASRVGGDDRGGAGGWETGVEVEVGSEPMTVVDGFA